MEAELKDFINGGRKFWEEVSVIEEKLSTLPKEKYKNMNEQIDFFIYK